MVHGFFALFLMQAIVIKASCTYCLAMEAIMPALRVLGFLLPGPAASGAPAEAGTQAEQPREGRADEASSAATSGTLSDR